MRNKNGFRKKGWCTLYYNNEIIDQKFFWQLHDRKEIFIEWNKRIKAAKNKGAIHITVIYDTESIDRWIARKEKNLYLKQ